MPAREPYRNRVELLQGTLDMLILRTLQTGPQHGYGISQRIRSTSKDVLQVWSVIGDFREHLFKLYFKVVFLWADRPTNRDENLCTMTLGAKRPGSSSHWMS